MLTEFKPKTVGFAQRGEKNNTITQPNLSDQTKRSPVDRENKSSFQPPACD